MKSNEICSSVSVERVNPDNFDEVLPLIGLYQSFYGKICNIEQNRKFFGQFLTCDTRGIQFCARQDGHRVVGFVTLYFQFSSLKPGTMCVLNDLYVDESSRSMGIAKKLINHSWQYASENGFDSINWVTATENKAAQKLYDSLTEDKSDWYAYSYKG